MQFITLTQIVWLNCLMATLASSQGIFQRLNWTKCDKVLDFLIATLLVMHPYWSTFDENGEKPLRGRNKFRLMHLPRGLFLFLSICILISIYIVCMPLKRNIFIDQYIRMNNNSFAMMTHACWNWEMFSSFLSQIKWPSRNYSQYEETINQS